MPSALPFEKRALSMREAAEFIGVSVSTLERMIKARSCDLPHFKVRRQYRFIGADLMEWREKQKAKQALGRTKTKIQFA